MLFDDYLSCMKMMFYTTRLVLEGFVLSMLLSQAEAVTTHAHTVELAVIVDYSDYIYWFERTDSHETTARRDTIAVNNIQQHVASLIKSSNNAYKSLLKYNISLNIKLVGVTITKTAQQSYWTENVKYKAGGEEQVVVTDVFRALIPYSLNMQNVIPHDHAMILTRYTLHNHNRTDGDAIGVAEVAAECYPRSVSIVQENGFMTAKVIAHELGHSLGCEHDGKDNTCNGDDGYVMSPAEDVFHTNRWQFSSCSANYIKAYITKITGLKKACLDSIGNRHPVGVVQNAQWFGQLYNADEQCQFVYGDKSNFCRLGYGGNYTDVCHIFACRNPVNDTCYDLGNGMADGTPCGQGKWCMSNNCVNAGHISHATDKCVSGDQQGIVRYNKTCAQLVQEDPNNCNSYAVKYGCCRSCHNVQTHSVNVNLQCKARYGAASSVCWSGSVYDNVTLSDVMCKKLDCFDPQDHTQCFYGLADDKTVCGNYKWCIDGKCVYDTNAHPSNDQCAWGDIAGIADFNLTCAEIAQRRNHHYCYTMSISRLCCNTCQKLKRHNTGCEFGDKSEDCFTMIPNQKDLCYDSKNAGICCEMCPSLANTRHIGCEFGDKSDDCFTIIPNRKELCYDSKNAGICCDMCPKLANNGHRGCEFGDSADNCEVRLCSLYSSEDRQKCCETCRGMAVIG